MNNQVLFFFNDTATTEIYTLSLHDALPIFHTTSFHDLLSVFALSTSWSRGRTPPCSTISSHALPRASANAASCRSEEHTSELQSQSNLVCRLLLDKKTSSRHDERHPIYTRS